MQKIPEPVFSQLAREFKAATDDELQGRLQYTGQMIVAAVADEAAGISEAVTNLLGWLTDGERFSQKWIAAVISTEGKSREAMNSQG